MLDLLHHKLIVKKNPFYRRCTIPHDDTLRMTEWLQDFVLKLNERNDKLIISDFKLKRKIKYIDIILTYVLILYEIYHYNEIQLLDRISFLINHILSYKNEIYMHHLGMLKFENKKFDGKLLSKIYLVLKGKKHFFKFDFYLLFIKKKLKLIYKIMENEMVCHLCLIAYDDNMFSYCDNHYHCEKCDKIFIDNICLQCFKKSKNKTKFVKCYY